MFFQMNEAAIKALHEQMAAQEAKTDAAGASSSQAGPDTSTASTIVIQPDGTVVVFTPSLLVSSEVSDEQPTAEMIDATQILSPVGWVPLRAHPLWRQP
jgi:hypothetical protein